MTSIGYTKRSYNITNNDPEILVNFCFVGIEPLKLNPLLVYDFVCEDFFIQRNQSERESKRNKRRREVYHTLRHGQETRR